MKALLIASSVAALIAGGGAQAQENPAAAPAPTAGTEADDTIADIIVTASRREESLQRTALAISAVSADQLAEKGIVNVTEITKLVPAVKIGQLAGGAAQVTVRGVGNFGGNSFAEPGVAFNLDGQYIARNAGASGIFYDVRRVEVLKGPQGTLYGRNSTGGVVNIITNDPGDTFSGEATGEVGNLGTQRLSAAATLPVSDWLSIRVAGQIVDRDGRFVEGAGADKTKAARIKAKITPTPALTILLEADYARTKGGGTFGGFKLPGYNFFKNSGTSAAQNAVFNLVPPPVSAALPRIIDNAFVDIKGRGLAATATYDFGPAVLTGIVANRTNEPYYLHYGAGFPVSEDVRDDPAEWTTAELRLASSNSGPLKWVLGGFYFDDSLHTRISPDQGTTFQNANTYVKTKSYSGFAEGTYSVSDGFRVTLGGRYTSDKKEIEGRTVGPVLSPPQVDALACPAALGSVLTTVGGPFRNPANTASFRALCSSQVAGKKTFNKFTYKVGVEADVGPASLVYATVASGFKAGGFYSSLNTAPAGDFPNNGYKPETITAYTLGSKNRFLDNKLQINAEAFYWDYKDKQVPHIGIVQPGNNINLVVENAASAEIYGAEIEGLWRPLPGGELSFGVQYLHAKYKDFSYNVVVPARIQNPAATPATGCGFSPVLQPAGPGTVGVSTVDCSGKDVPFSPEWVVNLGYRQTIELAGGSAIIPGVSTHIEASFRAGEEYLAGQRQRRSMVSDADLTWVSASKALSITGYVQNIENRQVIQSSFVQPTLGLPRVVVRNPRTYGVRLGVNF